MSDTTIYGAGMAGLLAANMLRNLGVVVHEKKDALPHNHAALLRFRTDKVSNATGIPFKRVTVQKGLVTNSSLMPAQAASIKDQNQYSYKVTKSIQPRSIMSLEGGKRYVAPDDFITAMAETVQISYGKELDMSCITAAKGDAIISTIPMPALMNIVDWPQHKRPVFKHHPIWSIVIEIPKYLPCEAYQTVYNSDPTASWYRASITGNHAIIEVMEEPTYWDMLVDELRKECLGGVFGLTNTMINYSELKHTVTKQEFGKISSEADDRLRCEFIMAMTTQYNIYSVGRFATWRQIVLDDVVDDVLRVRDMMLGNKYDMAAKYLEKRNGSV